MCSPRDCGDGEGNGVGGAGVLAPTAICNLVYLAIHKSARTRIRAVAHFVFLLAFFFAPPFALCLPA